MRNRDFALFLTGAFLSNAGSWMQNITVPFVVYEVTGSASWVGFVAFAQFIPAVVVGPLGGVLADRISRRRILLATSLLGALAASGLAVVWADGHASPWVTAGLVTVTGVSIGLMLPAWQAMVPQLAPRDQLLNAITLNSAQFNASRTVGPALGGVVLLRFGASTAFTVNALSYVAVIVALLAIRAPEPSSEAGSGRVREQFREVIAYSRERAGVVVALVVVACVAFLGSPVLQLAAVLSQEQLGVGEDVYGMIVAAFGAGGVIGAVVVSGYADGVNRSSLVAASVVLYGLGLVAVGLSPSYPAALAGMFTLGAAYLVAVSTANTSIQLLVGEEVRGRVMALYSMAITAGIPLGALLQGRLTDLVGVRETLTGAGFLLLAVAVGLVVRPALRRTLDEQAGVVTIPASVPGAR
ncbi:MAG: MFS transporter [Acidimicrobiia bacterium]|nr:MFS transporter [Acidimicrobiia bacterium]